MDLVRSNVDNKLLDKSVQCSDMVNRIYWGIINILLIVLLESEINEN